MSSLASEGMAPPKRAVRMLSSRFAPGDDEGVAAEGVATDTAAGGVQSAPPGSVKT